MRESVPLDRQTATVRSRTGFVRGSLVLASSLRVGPASTERARNSPFSPYTMCCLEEKVGVSHQCGRFERKLTCIRISNVTFTRRE